MGVGGACSSPCTTSQVWLVPLWSLLHLTFCPHIVLVLQIALSTLYDRAQANFVFELKRDCLTRLRTATNVKLLVVTTASGG